MAVPASYASEYALATMMQETIGIDMAATLVWTLGPTPDAGSYKRAVYAALRMVGVDDVTDATDMDRLEAAARLAVWTLVMQHTAHYPTTSLDMVGVDLSQIHDNASKQVVRARIDAMRTGIGYAVTSTPLAYRDLYGPLERTTGVA